MKITIFGLGTAGTTIVKSLIGEGHDITVVDTDPDLVSDITNRFDIMGYCGKGVDCDTFIEAEVSNADMFIGVSGSDELNMLACHIARKMGAKNTVARIRNPEYNDQNLESMRKYLDLTTTMNSDALVAHEIYNILRFPSAIKVETFTGRKLEMVELLIKADSPMVGLAMMEIRKKYVGKFLVCSVLRDDDVFIPDGRFVIEGGDRVFLSAAPTEVQKLLKNLGILKRQSRDVMITGGGRITVYLSKLLIASGINVKIIVKDEAKCREIANILPNADVICGDGTNGNLLLEEGVKSMDAFVSLLDTDEENILNSYFVSGFDVPKIVTKIEREEMAPTAKKLGLDCLVAPQAAVAGIILRYVRAIENSMGSNVERLYKICDGKAEALEFNVLPEFQYCRIPLKKMKLKPNVIIAGIVRDRKPIIPVGDDEIFPGDKVVVLSTGHTLNDLSDIIQK